jgi:molecular chaperone Hsp33
MHGMSATPAFLHDRLQRFLFERLGIRGEHVVLADSWQTVLARHEYPASVRGHLGEALAGVVMLSSTLKYSGSLILQLQGQGPLHTVVAQATHDRRLRGLARWHEVPPPGDLTQTMGDGRLVLTLYNDGSEPYQGIVPLEGRDVAGAVEGYFQRSEQLATRLWLAADGERAAGLLLQELPRQGGLALDWERVTLLAGTITTEELLGLSSLELCRRLFHEEEVRLFEPEPVRFSCGCSRERIIATLRLLGEEELEAACAASEDDAVTVDCEFCNQQHRFDRVDLASLFQERLVQPASPSRQ